jgi:hypothetical protein
MPLIESEQHLYLPFHHFSNGFRGDDLKQRRPEEDLAERAALDGHIVRGHRGHCVHVTRQLVEGGSDESA